MIEKLEDRRLSSVTAAPVDVATSPSPTETAVTVSATSDVQAKEMTEEELKKYQQQMQAYNAFMSMLTNLAQMTYQTNKDIAQSLRG